MGDIATTDELTSLLDAVQAMARACAEPGLDRAIEALLAIVARATRSERATLFTVDDGAELLRRVGVHPRDVRTRGPESLALRGTTTGGAVLAGRPVAWSPVPEELPPELAALGPFEVAAVPLASQGRVTAVMHVGRRGAAAYTPDELRFAARLGQLLLVYVDNARLYEDARRRLVESTMVVEATRALAGCVELPDRLQLSADVIARLLDASNAHLLVLTPDGRTLAGASTSNASFREEFLGIRIDVQAASIAARAVRTRATLSLEDLASSTEVRRDIVERLGEKSLLALPLLVDGEPIGAVVVDDTRRTRTWSRTEVEHAELVARMVAVLITNARLYDEVQRNSAELVRAQRELVRRERLAAIGEMAATIAHEVRNPLGVVFNSLGTLARIVPPSGDGRVLVDIMQEEATRLERLVRQLLDYARPPEPVVGPEPLHALVAGALASTTAATGNAAAPRVTVRVSPEGATVAVDAALMHRAVVNVLSNAIDAATPAGDVTVDASVDGAPGRRVATIAITDTGDGVAGAIAARVFEPFFTTKPTGTGLGLAIAKGIVESHGGEIAFASTPGAGTSVRLVFPADDEPPHA